MAFDSFMGSPADEGFITLQDPAPVQPTSTPNPKMKNFGNTEMMSFKTDDSAMDLVNSPGTKRDFGLGSASIPVQQPRGKTPKQGRLGLIQWKSSETLLVGAGFFSLGLLSKVLFDRYYK
jgi:hypothetical protein